MLKKEKKINPGVALILILMLWLTICVHAQETDKQGPDFKERLNKITKGEAGGKALRGDEAEQSVIPLSPESDILDPPTKEKYLAALREYYAYHISGLQHRQKVFKWQLISSKVIFVAVLVLVFAGIYFAAVQFHKDLGRKPKKEASESSKVTEFAASVKGIKVSSPILGVIILVISLAFFYLYLVYVYPIKEIF